MLDHDGIERHGFQAMARVLLSLLFVGFSTGWRGVLGEKVLQLFCYAEKKGFEPDDRKIMDSAMVRAQIMLECRKFEKIKLKGSAKVFPPLTD